MTQGMRRGTPSAELFGGLLTMIRTAGTGASMRQFGEKIGAPAATVSQVEKGQRALKEPKIAVWSKALDIKESDLLELWRLSQGEVLVDDRRKFYTDGGEGLRTEMMSADIVEVLNERPDLEPIYRLAELIATVLKKVLPYASVQVEPAEFEPLHIDKTAAGLMLTGAEADAQIEHAAAFVRLPFIECYWDNTPGARQLSERDRVLVPLLQEPTPIVRRRGRSVNSVELEDLIRDLSGPERERVRGYVEAIVEQRSSGF
jgi:transcriptional regulator with XRE-family HTH domain